MNTYQKLGIALLSLTAFNHQTLSAQAGTLTQPYPITLNSDTTQPSNNNQIPDYATLLKNCGETGTQSNLDNALASVLPNSNPQISSDSHQEVPEPTTIAGLALAAGIGSWWRKKDRHKI